MSSPRLHWYQTENIEKTIEKLMNIDFSNLLEVKELRKKLISEISESINFHVHIHSVLEEFHDCSEYESRTRFGQKMLRILEETIRELENEA